jgi:large subunit ribosomal protein L24
MAKLRIKRDDTVKVIAGRDKGKVGRVLRVIPEDNRVVVEGVHKVKRAQRPAGDQPGAIIEKELSVHVSNVALWDSSAGATVKVAYKNNEDGKKVRVNRKTGAVIDTL